MATRGPETCLGGPPQPASRRKPRKSVFLGNMVSILGRQDLAGGKLAGVQQTQAVLVLLSRGPYRKQIEGADAAGHEDAAPGTRTQHGSRRAARSLLDPGGQNLAG